MLEIQLFMLILYLPAKYLGQGTNVDIIQVKYIISLEILSGILEVVVERTCL